MTSPMLRRLFILSLLPVAAAFAGPAEVAAGLLQDPKVQQALEFVRTNEPKIIEQQIRLTEIPAPPFHEQQRAEAYKKLFEERGLRHVRIDEAGNVLGERPGNGPEPHLVFSAHIDTVFPPETDVSVERDGTVLKGPGIGDDGRGLAVVLGVIDALNHAGIETDGPITFVGTIGEEGLGDLRGVKHLFQKELKDRIDRFITVDGTRHGITNIGVGSYRYRVTFSGPGGHSFGNFGVASPVHALGRLIAKVSDFEVPQKPKTTFNVGRIWGGTSVNSIAFEAVFEVDMRSADKDSLETLHAKFRKAADEAFEEEKERWEGKGDLQIELDLVGDRPPGVTAASTPEVVASLAVSKALGLDTELTEGSNDANVGMWLGIPSLKIGGGGAGTGAHSPGETFDTADSWKGTQRALLVAIVLAMDLD